MKFKNSKLLKFLTSPVVKTIIGLIPFGIGSMASNFLNKVNESEPGEVDGEAFYVDIIKLAFYAILAVLVYRGVITIEDVEVMKGVIE